MTIQQELNAAAVLAFIVVVGSTVSAFRTPPGAKRTYLVVMVMFCMLLGINATTSSWQRTLSSSVQATLATSYLVLTLVVGAFLFFSSNALRKSAAPASKTPEGP